MHAVEDVLVHDVDLSVGVLADLVQAFAQLVKAHRRLVDLNQHYHGEHILQNALGDLHYTNIYTVIIVFFYGKVKLNLA